VRMISEEEEDVVFLFWDTKIKINGHANCFV
jgi:hypothetical protein